MADAEQTTPDEVEKNTGEAEPVPEIQTGKSEGSSKTFTQADLDRVVANARREEKKRLEKQLSDSSLSETERLKRELADVQGRYKALTAEKQIQQALKAAGAIDLDLISTWILNKLEVEYSEEGKIQNMKTLLAEVKEQLPGQFSRRVGTVNAAEGRQSQGVGGSMNNLIRRAAGRLPE